LIEKGKRMPKPNVASQRLVKPSRYAELRIRESIESLCLPKAREAFEFLYNTLHNEEAPLKIRYDCATQIIDRAYGRVVDRVQLHQVTDGSSTASPTAMTTEQLIALLSPPNHQELAIEAECEVVPPPDALTQGV
jgi:hypothetical protein